jgi:rhodanese-related sulfurtransferase
MKNFLILIPLFLFSLLQAEEMLYNDDVDAPEAMRMIEKEGAVLIDVRDPVEFLYAGHPAGALNIPIFFVRVDLPPLQTRRKVAELEKKKGKAIHPKKTYRPMMDENKRFVEAVKKAVAGRLHTAIIVSCRSGERSLYAANKLAKNGFDNVYNLEGGYLFDWKPAGLPSGGQ